MGGRFLAWVARGRMLLRNMVLAWRRHDGLLKSVKSFSCAGEGGAAGLRPAPAVVPAAGRQQPKPKPKPKRLGFSVGLAGRCGLAGHAVNPPPGSGPAAGGWAFGRLRSSASQAKRPHPWGLDGALRVCAVLRTRQDRGWASCPTRPRHASGPWRQRSCQPTSPHPRQFPGDGWIGLGITRGHAVRSVFRWKTDLIPIDFVIRQRLIHAWRGSTADREKLSKAGWVRLRGREPHGCGDRAYMDVLAAAPATGPTPPPHRKSASAVAVAVAPARSGCRAQPCRTPPSHAAPQNAFG